MIKCSKCGALVKEGQKFCSKCGTRIEIDTVQFQKPEEIIICSKCGTPNPITAKFCKKDGTPLREIKTAAELEKEIEIKAEVKKETPKKSSRIFLWLIISIIILIILGIGSFFLWHYFTTGEIIISYSSNEVAKIEIDGIEYEGGSRKVKRGPHEVKIKGTPGYKDTIFVVTVGGREKKYLQISLIPKREEIILTENDEIEIKETIYKWRDAWERGDLFEYMSYYSPNFYAPYKKMNYWQWREYKKGLFNKYLWMKIEIGPIFLQRIGNAVKAIFYQKFSSSHYSDEGTKILIFVKTDEGWKIIEEDFKENIYP